MRNQILRFLQALDTALVPHASAGERLNLYVIGKAAVILFYEGEQAGAMTSDVDVVQISSPRLPLLARAIELFGKGTPAATTHGLYLEAVPDGLPPTPAGFEKRCTPMPGAWRVLAVQQPEVHDLAVTKLKRYASKDRDDLRHLCDKGLLRAERLRECLESEFRWSLEKDGDPDRDRAFANLGRVIAYLNGESPGL